MKIGTKWMTMQKTDSTRLKTAIVGCGKVGGTHAQAYQSLPNFRVCMLCAMSHAERADAFAESFKSMATPILLKC